jgi:hypothetical protein
MIDIKWQAGTSPNLPAKQLQFEIGLHITKRGLSVAWARQSGLFIAVRCRGSLIQSATVIAAARSFAVDRVQKGAQ